MDNNNNTFNDVAKTTKDTAKAAVSTGKMAAKLAAQDYIGAFKEFIKNPTGILLTIITPLVAILLVTVIIMNTLTNSIWNVIADRPVSSMVDEYIEDLNYVEKECFYKACDSVSNEMLKEISEKVLEIDLGDNTLNKTKKENFKDAETIQDNLGMAYNTMREYSSNGNSYPLYDKILMGEAKIFPLAEDESNGFNIEYNNAGMTPNTTWQRITHLIDFNTNEKTYQKYIKKSDVTYESSSFDGLQTELNKTNKVLYTFTYNNERINDSGYTFSMLEMIFNEKYDYEAQKEINEGENSLAAKFTNGLNTIKNNSNSYNKITYETVLNNVKSIYDMAGNKAYYLDSEYVSEFNGYVDEYNNKFLKDADEDEKYKHLASEESYITELADGAREDRKTAFKKFISKKEFYEKLLTGNVTVNYDDATNQNQIELEFPNVSDKLKGSNIVVEGIVKNVKIDINVDICDYDTLAQLFGYKIQNENGEWVDNEELLNWIITSGGLDPDNVNKTENNVSSEESTSSEVVSSEETSSSEEVIEEIVNLNVDSNTFLWPLDLSDENIKVSSGYELGRTNPVTGKVEDHKAIDIAAPINTKIAASLPGKVTRANWSNSYGNVVYVESQVLINGEEKTVRTVYAHMNGIAVAKDAVVTRGESLIGYVGNTGQSTGPHLHFEVQIYNDATGKFEKINPVDLLNGEGLYYLNSSALANFDGSLNSFFENCKDSGTATASILADAGYTKSSMYWQYKNNVYNTMFKSAVSDSSKQQFFVDLDNIVKNDDGSLKIVEYSSADYKIMNSFLGITTTGDNKNLAEDSELKYNKRYYAVYCYPNTVVQMNMSAYRTNFNYERMKHQNTKDMIYYNEIAGSKGGVNCIISRLPCNISNTDSKIGRYVTSNSELKKINEKESEKALTISSYNKSDYESTQQFSYLSYIFANISYGFEVDNLQISFPDGNGGEHLMTAADYNNGNYGVFHLNKDIKDKTVTEKFNSEDNDSDFQMGDTILGNVLDENFYPNYWKPYDESDTSTYPFFVVSVANIQFGDKSGMNIEPPALEDIFDLDVVGDNTYVDNGSGMAWPLIKSFENTNDVYPLFKGTVISVNKDENQILIKDNVGTMSLVKNIVPEDNITGAFDTNTLLGRVPYGLEVQMANVKKNEDGSYEEVRVVNAAKNFKTVLSISSRSETSMSENSEGRYNKVVSMMNGYVVDATKTSLKVKSEEQGLYYEYTNLSVDDNILERIESEEKVPLTSGSEVGILYLTGNNNEVNHLSVVVYSDGLNEYDNSIQYYNPANFFKRLGEEATSARKILIQGTNNQTLSGIILNRGDSMQLNAKVTPESAKGAKVKWYSDNPDLVSVDENGKITASDKYGVATIICTFDDGKDGISGICLVNVPEKRIDISISCANGYTQPEDGSLSNDKYTPCTLVLSPNPASDSVLEITMENNNPAKADFNAYTTQAAALRSVKWSIVDENGSPNTEYATINERGSLTSKKPMTENQVLYVKAESVDKEDPVSVMVAIRIVQPLKSITLSPDSMTFVMNSNGGSKTQSYSYKCEPENATYQSVTTSLTGGAEKAFTFDTNNKTVTSTGVGAGYLKIVSTHYPNITSQIQLKSGMMVDEVKIINKPNQLMSGEEYQFNIRGYYKGVEVSLDSDGIGVNWDITKFKKPYNRYPSYVVGNVEVKDNNVICIPQIFGEKSADIAGTVTVTSMNGTVSDEFTFKAYPFVSFSGTNWADSNDSRIVYPIYIIKTEEAQDFIGSTASDAFRVSYLPGGFNTNTEVTLLNPFDNIATINVKDSDTVYVNYDKDKKKIVALLKGDNVSGTFTVVVKFKDGKEYTGEFIVQKGED